MQYTTKLNLKKPDSTDYVNVSDINDNMEILDNAVSSLQEGSSEIPDLQTNDKKLAGAINEVNTKVTEHLDERATPDKLGHVKAETTPDGTIIIPKPPKSNFNANREPTKNDDVTQGYEVGSMWYYQESVGVTRAYVCLSAGIGSADWVQYTYSAGAGVSYYNEGLENIAWTPVIYAPANTYSTQNPTKEPNFLQVYVYRNGGTGGEPKAGFSTSNRVKLDGISTLFVEYEIDSTDVGKFLFEVAESVDGVSDYVARKSVDVTNTNGKKVESFQIGNMYGNYFIRISLSYISTNGREGTLKIHKIWGA